MPTIERCVIRIAPVLRDDGGAHVLARFQAEPEALALAVTDDGRVLGLIERDAFLLAAAGRFGPALTLGRRAVDLMDPEPAIIESNLALDRLPPSMLSGDAVTLRRPFVVTRGGVYLGLGTGVGLIQAANERLEASLAELKDAGAREAELQARIADAAGERSRFLGRVGNELRTPLNGVGAVADMLRRQPLNATAAAHVQTIADSADATLRLLQDAIDLARLQAGDDIFEPRPCALQPLIDALQVEWGPRARAADVSLMLGYEGDTELAVEIDGGRLTQVLDNLIANAVERARHGVVEASLKAVADGERVRIAVTVRDDATDADRPDIRVAQAPEDAGLSVAISHHLVRALGGVLTGSSNRGRGGTFTFALEAQRAAIEDEAGSNVSDIADLNLATAPHVLIVDDNATNRVVAQALCEMFGCTCETAEDGVEAVEAVLTRGFDLILMDIKMPRMDGVAATAAIRALAGDAGKTPVVALTANADPEDARRYLASGMVAVVEKPIKPERLRMAMNMAMAQDAQASDVGAVSASRVA